MDNAIIPISYVIILQLYCRAIAFIKDIIYSRPMVAVCNTTALISRDLDNEFDFPLLKVLWNT